MSLFKAIEMVLDHLSPYKVNIMVFDKKYLPDGVSYSKMEPWFKTPYVDLGKIGLVTCCTCLFDFFWLSLDIPIEWQQDWAIAKPKPELQLPLPNAYLTTDFSLLPLVENNPEYPEKISFSAEYELWYKRDQKFGLPVACYYYYFITPLSIESPTR